MGDVGIGKWRGGGGCDWARANGAEVVEEKNVLPYIEIEKSTLGCFGLLSGSMGILGVASMSKKCLKMLSQCRRPILKMLSQCRKRSDVSAEKNDK